ncbi:unnamed protein product [Acanthoscelides obtectus]|uniref:Uncharacterized protein n=1 Tax=Acanthoscelides obtectus TaxID=200917 RepID=A0A9P0M6T2_ACAOB|nr:unnamed protein product [Acanthoscelides obtectus]CAK1660151.1 Putative uncharacterized protein YAL004W [Acanthoscelides obtectus]
MKSCYLPPTVSIPRVSGLTSSSTIASVSCSPDRTPACTAAPYATASSGLIPREGSLPPKKSFTNCWILGIRVDPPTNTISSMSFLFMSASSSTFCTGFSVDRNRSMFSSSNLALLDEVIHDPLVKVLTSQMGISIGGDYLEHAVIDRQKGYIESTTAQIEHQDVLLAILFVQTVRDSGCGRLVDDTHHVQTGDDTWKENTGLSLSIIEVSWHSHNSVGNLLPQVRFGSLLHLAEDHSGDFLGGEHLGALTGFHLDVRFAVLLDDLEGEQFDVMLDVSVVEFATNQTLRVEDGVFRIGGQLILGCVTDQTFTVRRERHVRGGDPVTLVVCYYLHSPVLVYTHAVKVMMNENVQNQMLKILTFS